MKVLLIDDHPIFRNGIKGILANSFKNIEIIECDNGKDALELITKEKPVIAILDINIPNINGLEVLLELHKKNKSSTKTIILSMYKEKELVKKVIKYGACGYILKDSSFTELLECIRNVMKGEKYIDRAFTTSHFEAIPGDTKESNFISSLQLLNHSELKLVKLIGQNKTTEEIASLLFLSKKTIENYRSNICQKLSLPPRNNNLLLWVNEHKELLYMINEFDSSTNIDGATKNQPS